VTIPVTRPVLGDSELAAIASVLDSGYLVQGSRVAEFERIVAEHVGLQHAVAVSSCTSALRVALLALGIGSGHRVIVAPYSWVATANVIELCGATPVFVDIDPSTFNMDAALLRSRLDSLSRAGEIGSVRAVMPVHTFGNTAGVDDIVMVADEFSIPVIEDAACAVGATVEGRPAGSLGTIGCFSFHPRKIITTGEGGMLVTDDDDLAGFARTFRNHGQRVGVARPDVHEHRRRAAAHALAARHVHAAPFTAQRGARGRQPGAERAGVDHVVLRGRAFLMRMIENRRLDTTTASRNVHRSGRTRTATPRWSNSPIGSAHRRTPSGSTATRLTK